MVVGNLVGKGRRHLKLAGTKERNNERNRKRKKLEKDLHKTRQRDESDQDSWCGGLGGGGEGMVEGEDEETVITKDSW